MCMVLACGEGMAERTGLGSVLGADRDQRARPGDPNQQETGSVFLGHEFQPVRLEDAAVLKDYLRHYPQRVSG